MYLGPHANIYVHCTVRTVHGGELRRFRGHGRPTQRVHTRIIYTYYRYTRLNEKKIRTRDHRPHLGGFQGVCVMRFLYLFSHPILDSTLMDVFYYRLKCVDMRIVTEKSSQ